MLLKYCCQYASKFGKLSSGHRTGKGLFSFQSQRKCQRMFKLLYSCANFTCQQGNAQNPSSQASTVREVRTSKCISWIQKRQRNQKSNCQHLLDHRKIKGIKKKYIYFCFIDYVKAFDCVDHNKLQKILKEMGIQDRLTCLQRGQETTV